MGYVTDDLESMQGTVLVFFSVSGVVLLINSYGLGKGCHNFNFKKMNKYGFFTTLNSKKPSWKFNNM